MSKDTITPPTVQERNDFKNLFRGREDFYGSNILTGGNDEKGKKRAINKTTHAACSIVQYEEHLEGKCGLGIIPITQEDKCYFGAIDIDDYRVGSKDKLLITLYKTGMPLLPFRSKSGGTHLYLFFHPSTPSTAQDTIDILSKFRTLLNLPKKTEIFPKQRSVSGSTGNWINLPYFNTTERCLIGQNGEDIGFSDALELMKRSRTSKEEIGRFLTELPFSDGPPCLQILALNGVEDNRNNFLFSAARYYKTKFGDDLFEEKVLELNNTLQVPLSKKEIEATVFASHKRADYNSYRCSEAPLCDVCFKNECRDRQYGNGGGEVSELSYGQIVQYMTDPPYYKWPINGQEFTFFSEGDIIDQKIFHKLALRILHYKPSILKAFKWDKIINDAFKNVKVVYPEAISSFQDIVTLKEIVGEYLVETSKAINKMQLKMLGRPWVEVNEEGDAVYYFDPKKLKSYILELKGFRKYGLTELGFKLEELGAKATSIFIDETTPNYLVWCIARKDLEKFQKDTSEPPKEDSLLSGIEKVEDDSKLGF
jgi:hypothetical protein